MNLDRIISEIDHEISRLQQAKQLLSANLSDSLVVKRGPGRPRIASKPAAVKGVGTKRRTMSAAGRARIAAAQKARWAKTKKAAKKAAKATPGSPAA